MIPDERRQFRILYRDLLARMVDLDIVSAGGDPGRLFGQGVAILAALSFTFLLVTASKYLTGAIPAEQLQLAAQAEIEFLFATTLAVAGMIAVLGWNLLLPDRRDCVILGVLPVRLRTIFLARVAAIGTAIGAGVLAIDSFTGLAYPFMLSAPGGATPARILVAYWIAAAGVALFVCFALLAVQGVSALLFSRRAFLRISGGIQVAAFVAILGSYFLKPPLLLPLTSKSLAISWEPSFWFYALFQSAAGTAPAILEPLAWRALAWTLALGIVAAVAYSLAFRRALRRVLEQPDLVPANRTLGARRLARFLLERLLPAPLERAVFLFAARTLARSRQHRLLVAAFGGIGLAVGLAYAKDLVYGYSGGVWDSLGVNADANRYWDRANIPLLAGSLVLLTVAIAGVRAAFSLPAELRANWIFRIAAVHRPGDYFAAARKTLLGLAALPVWLAAAAAFLLIWPIGQALEHVAILVAAGILLAELSLGRFRKIPFACSYLPGKSNMTVRFGVYATLSLLLADRGVALEYWAMHDPLAFAALFTLLCVAASWAHRRRARFAEAHGNTVQFEETPPSEIFALDLRRDGAWSNDEAQAAAVDARRGANPAPLEQPPRSGAAFLTLNAAPPMPDASHESAPPARVRYEQLLQDLRQSARIFRSARGFSAVTIFLITLGLGANLTIYSVIRTVLSKPAPGVDGNGLVIFGHTIDGRLGDGGPENSYPNYLDLAAQTRTMSALAASVPAPWLTLSLADGTYEVRGEMVSANYFRTLGVPLIRGRSFTAEESAGRGGLAVVIAYHLWQDHFHGAANIVGQRVAVNGFPATVIGVTGPGFHGAGFAPHFELGLPPLAFSRLRGTESRLLDRRDRAATIFGRLSEGATLSAARTEFATLSDRLRERYPEENRGWAVVPAPYSMTRFGPNASPQARLLMAGVSLIGLLGLLVVCANVASLVLGRSVARRRDIAVRVSLGAPRGRILRMLVAEGLMLSLAACAAAWPLTLLLTRAFGALAPPLESGARVRLDLSPDEHVFAYGILLAVVATLASTLAPMLGLWRQKALPVLKAAAPSISRRDPPLLRALVVGQVALCAMLVTTALLAYQSLFHIDNSGLFFRRENLLLANVNTAGAAAGGRENLALLERIRQRLLRIDGVARVSYATAAPPHDHGWMDTPVRAADSDRSTITDGTIAGPDYIQALDVPDLEGRDLSAADAAAGRATAVINRRLAGELWPGESALGRRMLLGEGRRLIEVVGVVPDGAFSGVAKDGSFRGIGKDARPSFLFLAELPDSSAPGAKTFHIRYTGEIERIVPEIRSAVHEADARVPVFSVRTMEQEFREFTAPIRIPTMLIGLFAGSALLLSFVGLYAAIAFHTLGRAREFGIRAALGGTPAQLLGAVLKHGFVLTLTGLAIGLASAAAVARSAGSLLFGVDPTDHKTYIGVAALLALLCLSASFRPARRISRSDPMTALRHD